MSFPASLFAVRKLCLKIFNPKRAMGLASVWTGHTQGYQSATQSSKLCESCQEHRGRQKSNHRFKFIITTNAMFFGLFEPDKSDDETPDIIMTIKRSILMIQRGEYKKAEQMLHIALRQAQALQNHDAITYIYDVMANLAFDMGEYRKAEVLFVKVMQRLIANGTSQTDLKIIHMSLKMAKLFEHLGETEKAEDGYQFCLNHLQAKLDEKSEDEDVVVLWAMAADWYARLLLAQSKYEKALEYLQKAYKVCIDVNGEEHEQTVVLLNDLGTISFLKGDNEKAIDYFTLAAEIGDKLPDMEDLSSIHVNLGNVLMKKGLYDAAKKSCQRGWYLSKSRNNEESLVEANDCLDEIRKIAAA
ncbi:tetratricopeptide repeat protein 19 homolog, mitochondrial isoform X1 [Athalia rosae]|uniref:tetratricopeptide repeat protein 19 homolog, mitochondrial isoform X1 n=2 Tax=Athalia rosae TaxID=37344 RepID=UPI002033E0E5|nr:tetratricopeptide repeat protein 19 homolog, mitochondrial isoform X1 [Athalia rosae]XP_048508335.1 tetratricopeptide repeat protein 19 homolog, mitochondrial isoform X1 [Athalia rosae]